MTPPLERRFRLEMHRYEEERNVPYVTSFERLAKEEGREEGRELGVVSEAHQALLDNLEVRLGAVPPAVRAQVESLHDLNALRELRRQVLRLESWDEVKRLIPGDGSAL